MTLFQALLIGLFAYLGSKRTPWFFGVTGGWNMIGRPLVAGLIVGIILGDVTNGVIAGAMVQALFIGQITPGGAMPADVNWAAYIGIPLQQYTYSVPSRHTATVARPEMCACQKGFHICIFDIHHSV